MADQHTMEELLRVSTEGYAEAIVVPLILAEQFELKHSLINMMISDQFFGLEKDNPHDHICWFKITSTIKYKDVPNSAIKLMLFPFSLAGAASSIKAVEEICITCGGAHPYYQCLAADGNTFPKVRDNIKGYVAAAAVNYNHGNGDPPVPDLRTMEELCQPSLNGQGGLIAHIAIQATDFGLKNDMIQQVQNSCQFHGLPGDDANKHLDKF
nr:reverse transcriptase domain-containing protein [Tanacetum cinerariifolium]